MHRAPMIRPKPGRQLQLTNLADMHSIRSASLPESAWSSDDYWAIYAGVIAKRYTDPNFPSSEDWKVLTDYVRSKQPSNPDDLSPGGKYDLLVGDTSKTMTAQPGRRPVLLPSYGKVETWMGILPWLGTGVVYDPAPDQGDRSPGG